MNDGTCATSHHILIYQSNHQHNLCSVSLSRKIISSCLVRPMYTKYYWYKERGKNKNTIS